jgi:hypothetical protein
MPQSYLIFDFAANEPAAQQARHRLEGWRQAFRLDRKLQVKFERTELEGAGAQKDEGASAESVEAKPAKAKAEKGKDEKAKSKAGKEKSAGVKTEKSKDDKAKAEAKEAEESKNEEAVNQHIRLIVRLDFSDHERLSHHRWLERIPSEEPFKDASPRVVRHGEAEFESTADLFDSLP